MRNRRRSGLTLVELTFAMAILAVAILGLFSTICATMLHQKHARLNERAMNAARAMAERLRAEPAFRRIYAGYNASAADDPAGPGTAPGPWFSVSGLTPPPGRALVGEIIFPEDASGVLREDLAIPSLGVPADMNGDGIVDADRRAGDYVVLPVVVRVVCLGPNGVVITQQYATVLNDRSDPGGGP